MLDKVVEACRYLLNNFPEARECKEYIDSRISPEMQELFQFGYFPGIQNLQVLTDMVGEDLLYEEELLWVKTMEDCMGPRKYPTSFFEHNPLIMPFRNAYGEVVGLVGRSLLGETDEKPEKWHKYKNTQESSRFKKGNLLFGLYENKQSIIDKGCVYIVEGQFDVIKAVEKGFDNIVALGTNSMTPYQFSVISRYTNNLYLLLDNDESGIKGRKKIIEQFGSFANIQDFYLPSPYKDIDEYLTKSGEESMSFVVRA